MSCHRSWLLCLGALALAVPLTEYAVVGRLWVPSHDDTLTLILTSGNKESGAALFGSPEASYTAADLQARMAPPARLMPGRVLEDLYRRDIHPPLYFLILHLWRRLFGGGMLTAITLGLGCSVTAALLLFANASRRAGPAAGAAIAALYCLSPAALEASLTARQYVLSAPLAVLLAAVVAGAPEHAQERPGRRAARFVTFATLLALTAYQCLPLLAALWGVWIMKLLPDRGSRERRAVLTAGVGCALTCLPIVLLARWQGAHAGALGPGGWLAAPQGGAEFIIARASQAFLSLFFDFPYSAIPAWGLLAGAACLVWLLGRDAGGRDPARPEWLFRGAILLACALYALPVLVGLFPPRFHNHYFAAYSGAFLMLLGMSMPSDPSARRRKTLLLTAIVALSGASLLIRLVLFVAHDRAAALGADADLRNAAAVVTDASVPGHILLIASRMTPGATLSTVHERLGEARCAALRAAGGPIVAVAVRPEALPELEREVVKCAGGLPPARRESLFWLSLLEWDAAGTGSPRSR